MGFTRADMVLLTLFAPLLRLVSLVITGRYRPGPSPYEDVRKAAMARSYLRRRFAAGADE